MAGIDLNEYNPAIQEYKGYRYFLIEHKYWTCGYIIIDLDLFTKLELRYCKNVTSNEYGYISWVSVPKLDKPVETQKENEIFFGIGDKRFEEFGYGVIPDRQETESIIKEWIDWIVKECKDIEQGAILQELTNKEAYQTSGYPLENTL